MAKGILGRKLGMTQVFDEETGASPAVTVIAAGPVPGRAGEDRGTDGYDAVQLAFDPVAELEAHAARARPPEALRRRPAPDARRVPRRRSTARSRARRVTVEVFEPGDEVKVAGIGIGKGFQGTIKRHNFSSGPRSHGSHNVRAPGSVGASATPSRVFKGIKMAGRMGGKRVTQTGLTVHEVDAERNLLLVKGSVPGPEERPRRGAAGS